MLADRPGSHAILVLPLSSGDNVPGRSRLQFPMESAAVVVDREGVLIGAMLLLAELGQVVGAEVRPPDLLHSRSSVFEVDCCAVR